MRKAIGVVIILYALSKFFTQSFSSFDDAASESFKAAEVAAIHAQARIERLPLE